jgi:hypothetical protein
MGHSARCQLGTSDFIYASISFYAVRGNPEYVASGVSNQFSSLARYTWEIYQAVTRPQTHYTPCDVFSLEPADWG